MSQPAQGGDFPTKYMLVEADGGNKFDDDRLTGTQTDTPMTSGSTTSSKEFALREAKLLDTTITWCC
jgi:hypothetical protein